MGPKLEHDGAELGRNERFVNNVITLCQQNKGVAARLRRADNPATEYQSWEILARFGVDLEREWQRLPFVTVAADIARAKVDRNGLMGLGQALTACYEKASQSEQAKARLRRLLACGSLPELCRVLRPTLSLIGSRAGKPLNYVRVLKQLRSFARYGQDVKAQWAQEFYGTSEKGGWGESE
jgi:CRISPR system Cascade subunit CasB